MDDWTTVLAGVGCTRRTLAAGEVLFHHGDEARALFHVERGRIRLTTANASAFSADAGEGFAEAALFTSHYPWTATAETPGRVRVFSKARVLLYLRAHPDLNLAFTAALVRRLDSLRMLNDILRQPSARNRVLAWLTQLGATGGPVTLNGPLMAAAAEIGLTHEALYRTLAALKREGRLERPGKRTFRLIP